MSARVAARRRPVRRVAMAALAALVGGLAACGGGGGDDDGPPPSPASCSVQDQKTWLRDYFADWYFWYGASPRPDPAAYADVDSYFLALLYPGGLSGFPAADRWSYKEPQASHTQFYGEGRDMGYGVFVAGLEVRDRPDLPLRVRYVEPKSPAAAFDVRRGDEVLSVNGRPASELVAADDFSVLTPSSTGQQMTLRLRRAGVERDVTLTAAEFDLTPVPDSRVIDTGDGRRTGYLVLKDFISQAEPQFDSAFASFRQAGITELVVDLRYNGGGLVSTASRLASYMAGGRAGGQVFARLLYNDRHQDSNATYTFANLPNAMALPKVYVLSGPRTCSASELVVNGLRPFTEVVSIGDTSCGKPVGFLPRSSCGTTYSIVNFESVNARNEGRYFDGFLPTCAVREDLSQPLGTVTETLLAAARHHARLNTCPVTSVQGGTMRALGMRALVARPAAGGGDEPARRSGMVDR